MSVRQKRKGTSWKAPVIDNLIEDDLLREEIIINLQIKQLQKRLEKIRQKIMDQMEDNEVLVSNNDIALIHVINRLSFGFRYSVFKEENPKLFQELEDAGYITRKEMKYLQIYSKI